MTAIPNGHPAGNAAAWWSLVFGTLAVAALPATIYVTRFVEGFELLQAGFAIPLAMALAAAAIASSRRAQKHHAMTLGRAGGMGVARAGRLLGILALCLAAAALIALGVYGALSYLETRD